MKQQLATAMARFLEEGERPRVSILLPTDPTNPTGPENRLRYRNLLRAAEQRAQAGGFDAGVIARVLKPAVALLDDASFWQHLGRGLAVYVASHVQGTYSLDYPVAERVAVGDHFLVAPLVPLLAEDRAFFILALSRGAVRLLHGARAGSDEVALPASVPKNLDAALGRDEYETEHRYVAGASSARGRPEAIFYSHGGGGNERTVQLHHYCEQIDRGLRDVAGLERVPLILAGEEETLGVYRQVTAHPQVLVGAIAGNPDRLTDAELHERAWPLIDAELRRERGQIVDRYRGLVGTGLASADPAEVVRAAHQGRVDTLLIPSDEPLWGTYAPEDGTLILHETAAPGDEDMANLAVVQALRHGGIVHAVARAQLPGGAPLAAIFRY